MDSSIVVLHVDDDPEFRTLVERRLPEYGERIDMRSARTGADALDRLDAADIDCVVSDYEMPGMDGIALLEAVRDRWPELPFVLITGKGSESVASDAISAGATDYLRKQGDAATFELLANRIENAVERSRAEQRARRTRERMERLLEGGADYVFIVDASGTVQYVSGAVRRVLGYDPEELIGSDAFETVHPDDTMTASDAFSGLLEDPETTATAEFRIEAADGSWRWVEARGRNLLDDPVVEGVVVNARDVTDRTERKEQLTLKNRVIDEAPLGITITDPDQPDNPIVYANRHFQELTGYAESEIIGRNCRFLQGERTEEGPTTRLREAIDRDEPVTVDLRNYRKDGTEFWNRVLVAPIERDGTVTNFVGFQQDVSDRMRRQQALQEYKRSVDTLVEHLPLVLFAFDDEAVLSRFEGAALAHVGLDPDESVGKSVFDLFAEHETIIDGVDRSLAGEAVDVTVHFQGRVFECWFQPIHNDEGELDRVTGIAWDLTDRVELQELFDGLHEQARQLLDAGDIDAICRIASRTAASLGTSSAALYRYDSERNVLRTPADVEGPLGDRIGPEDGPIWDAFVDQQRSVLSPDAVDQSPVYTSGPDHAGGIGLFPVREYGLLVACRDSGTPFDDRTLSLFDTIVADVSAAIEQVERAAELRASEAAIEAQAEQLRRLRERNDRLRTVAQELLIAGTRSEAETVLVEQLLDIPECVAVGLFRSGPRGESVSLLSAAGESADVFDAIQTERVDDAPTLSVCDSETPVYVPKVADRIGDDWGSLALGQDLSSAVSLPVTYDGINYGVLTLYADDIDPFDDETIDLFESFATTVARSLSLIESRNALSTGYDVEVEFDLPADGAPFGPFADRVDGPVTIDGIEPHLPGTYTVSGTSEDDADIERAVERVERVEEVQSTVPAGDGIRFTVLGSPPPELGRIIQHGGTVRELRLAPGGTQRQRLVLGFPSEAVVNQFIDRLLDRYEGAELRARRRTPGRTQLGAAADSLPAELLEAFQVAYEQGYFDRSRDVSGADVAEVLDVSSSTFHRRLRAAQRTLATGLFQS